MIVTIRVCTVCSRIVRTVFGQDVCACPDPTPAWNEEDSCT